MIISFFGHSDFVPSEACEDFMWDLLNNIVGDNPAEFYLGGYGRFDDFALTCCKRYKSEHKDVKLIFVTPYITLEYQKNRLENIKAEYDMILYPEIEDKPLRFAISYRNKWMIDKSDSVIVGISRTWGGAYKTYKYAISRKKTVYNLLS